MALSSALSLSPLLLGALCMTFGWWAFNTLDAMEPRTPAAWIRDTWVRLLVPLTVLLLLGGASAHVVFPSPFDSAVFLLGAAAALLCIALGYGLRWLDRREEEEKFLHGSE